MAVPLPTSPLSLTVAIPAYKRAEPLRSLLAQLQAQVGPDDEIIVSDDGADDAVAAVAGSMPRVKLLRHPVNLGMVGNWNACLRAAKHDWVCIIHDDDSLAPGGLDALRRACALAGGPALVAHEPFHEDLDDTFRCRLADAGPWTVLHAPEVPSGTVVHRTVVETVGSFDPRFSYSSDLEYFPRICARFPLVVVESPAVMKINFHGANYQFTTWRQPDFLAQLEALHRAIAGHAGLKGKEADALVRRRLTGNLAYMFDQARYWQDRSLLRAAGRRLLFQEGINWRYRLVIWLAVATGWTTRPKKHLC